MLHILRIVQEAVSNTLKHANATTIRVRTGDSGVNGLGFIEIGDDGSGLPEHYTRGRGLGNMRTRAARIGAELQLSSSSSGTTIRLLLRTAAPDVDDRHNRN